MTNPQDGWRAADECLDWLGDHPAVEFRLPDGTIRDGSIHCVDVGFNGEDEFPIHELTLTDGTLIDQWQDGLSWRPL